MLRTVWCARGMEHVGRAAASALGCPLLINAPVGDCDACHVVGMFDPPSYGVTLENTKRARTRVIHWCGPDVMLLPNPESLPEGAIHLCDSERLAAELAEKGVAAAIVPWPTGVHAPVSQLPAQPVVSVFLGDKPELYEASTVRAVMDALPEIRFTNYMQGSFDPDGMRLLIESTSVHLRLTQHDGSALSGREYLEAGRRVVTTQPLPFARQVPYDDLSAIVDALRSAVSEQEPDHEAAAFWRTENGPGRFRQRLRDAIGPLAAGLAS